MEIFVARQPIFDRKRDVFAYELLFRSSMENFFQGTDQDEASSRVIDNSIHDFGFTELTDGRPAFVNATREVLVQDYLQLLPAAMTVVEVLETVEPDEEVVAACVRLKAAGYLIALDDFEYRRQLEPLVDLADIVKVDFLANPDKRDRERLVARLNRPHLRLLAEKVETPADYNEGVSLGFELFQGYFFCKPEVVSRKGIPANKLNTMRFLQVINREDFDVNDLEDLIKHDVSLSYKLLKYLNSAAFGWREEISSIRHAIMMMGQRPMIKWANLVGLASLSDDKPQELIMTSLVRARFGELLGSEIGDSTTSFDLFLIGMFSLIDAITDRDLAMVLDELQIRSTIADTLTHRTNGDLGTSLSLVIAHEKGDWDGMGRLAADLGVTEDKIPALYQESLSWAGEVFAI